MEHSKNYEKVKAYYDMYVQSQGARGWSIEKVRNAVAKGWITEEEFFEITGEDYE
ncbi:MAG: XkdX family protein [Clostridia bacterium]|nr:XkdX family protein [Clostridia bacterium]